MNTNYVLSAIRARRAKNQISTIDKFARIRSTWTMSQMYHTKFKNLHFSQKTFLGRRFTISLWILVRFYISLFTRIHLVTNVFQKQKVVGWGHGRGRRLGFPKHLFVPYGDISLKRVCMSSLLKGASN